MEDKSLKFRIMKRGYDRFAVDDSIDRLNYEFSSLKQQLDAYQYEASQANEQLRVIKDRYQSLVQELNVREKAADDIARLALREANSVIASAQNNADSIVKEALSTAKLVLVEIARLSKEAKGIKQQMSIQIEDLGKALDAFEIPVIPALTYIEIKDEEQDKLD
ncbi:MAG: DivIVA domain-containing protein [Erysipelotrichaceae bacterium]